MAPLQEQGGLQSGFSEPTHAIRLQLRSMVLGIRKGDIVSFPLHNCVEFCALVICLHPHQCNYPSDNADLAPPFTEHLTEGRVLIVPDRSCGFDFCAMSEEVAAAVPRLRYVFAIGARVRQSTRPVVAAWSRTTVQQPGDSMVRDWA